MNNLWSHRPGAIVAGGPLGRYLLDMDDETKAEIEAIAEEYDKSTEKVREVYESKLEHIQSADVIGITEDDMKAEALATTRANLQSDQRSGGTTGSVEEIPIVALGSYGVFPTWGEDNDTVMVGAGVVAPEDTESDNRPPGIAVFIMNETDGVDIGKCRDLWQWGTHIRGWFALEKMSESFQARDRTYYLCQSTDKSKQEEADFGEDLPDSPREMQGMLANNFIKESFTIGTMADKLSVGGEDFGSQWADMRRYTGRVVDAYRRLPEDCEPDENPFGKYTLIPADADVSVEELEQNRELVTEDDVENGRQPGLQVYVPPEAVQYGEDSKLEVYGTLDRNDETGQITMSGVGAAPLVAFPYEEYDGNEGDDSDDTEVDEL